MMRTCLWTGAGDGVTWGEAANWEGGFVPEAGDDVILDGGRPPCPAPPEGLSLSKLEAYPNSEGYCGWAVAE